MVNLYDQPAQAQFMQTYVPVPFEELMQAGAMQQQRWEEGIKAEDALQTDFGNIQYLRNVSDTAGNVYETGIEKYAEEAVGQFKDRLEDIVAGVADKTSPEYRASIRNLVTDWRKANGPQGQFGRMKADVDRYKSRTESIEKEKIGSKTHRGVYSDMQTQNYLKQLQKGYTDYNVSTPILKDVDIHKELNETLKNVGETVLSNPSVANMPMDQVLRYHSSGVGYDRLVGITKNLISQNEDVKQDIIAQEIAKGNQGEDLEAAVNARIDQYADTMAKIYTKQKLDTSWTSDELAIHTGKKKIDNEEMVFANRVNLPLPATKGFQNYEELNETIETRKNTAAQLAVTAMDALAAEWNLPEGTVTVDPKTGKLVVKEPVEGISYIDTGSPAEFTDVARLVHGYNMQIEQSNKAASDAERLKNNLKRKHNITGDYLDSPEYKENVNKARNKATTRAQQLFSDAAPSVKSKYVKDWVSEHYEEFVQDIDPRYKAMNSELKEMSKSGSFEAAVVNLPKNFKDYLEFNITNLPHNVKLDWKDVRKGTTPLTEKERINLIDKAETKPVALGPYYDQATGKMEVLYSVKDKKGESFTVSSSMPQGMEKELYKNGLFDQFTSAVYTGLYDQIGAANNAAGTGVLNMPGDLSVDYYGKNSTGQYVVGIPLEGGKVEAVSFDTEGDMVNRLTQLSKAAIAKEIEQENK